MPGILGVELELGQFVSRLKVARCGEGNAGNINPSSRERADGSAVLPIRDQSLFLDDVLGIENGECGEFVFRPALFPLERNLPRHGSGPHAGGFDAGQKGG